MLASSASSQFLFLFFLYWKLWGCIYLLVYLEPDSFLKSVFLTDLLRKKKKKENTSKRKDVTLKAILPRGKPWWPSVPLLPAPGPLSRSISSLLLLQVPQFVLLEDKHENASPSWKTATWNPGGALLWSLARMCDMVSCPHVWLWRVVATW